MGFLQTDLGIIGPRNVVQVTLGAQARVLLLDASNYAAFQGGRAWKGQGGWAVKSPVRMSPQYDAHWHLVVDLNGNAGQVQASVQLI